MLEKVKNKIAPSQDMLIESLKMDVKTNYCFCEWCEMELNIQAFYSFLKL